MLTPCVKASEAVSYYGAISESYTLEQNGNQTEAANKLDLLVPQYPQDYTLAIRIAWLRFSAADYKKAVDGYKRVLEISTSSSDARLGLAWSYLYLDKCRDANPLFEGLKEDAIHSKSAVQGLEMCHIPTLILPWVEGSLTGYADHDNKKLLVGAGVGLPVLIRSEFLIGAVYRFHYLRLQDESPSWFESSYNQHEIYGRIGYVGTNWKAVLHGGYINDNSGYSGNWGLFGLSGRWSPSEAWGDWTASVSGSGYDDLTIWRIATAYSLPLLGWLRIKPGIAVLIGDETAFNGQLTLSIFGDWGSFFIGGKYGSEDRPTYVEQAIVHNTPETVTWGGWAGFNWIISKYLAVTISYNITGLESESSTGTVTESTSHSAVLRIDFSL